MAQYVNDRGFDLFAKNDYTFVNSIYDILHLLFKYTPPVSVDSFFAAGQADRKLLFILDVLSLIKQKHAVLNKRSNS